MVLLLWLIKKWSSFREIEVLRGRGGGGREGSEEDMSQDGLGRSLAYEMRGRIEDSEFDYPSTSSAALAKITPMHHSHFYTQSNPGIANLPKSQQQIGLQQVGIRRYGNNADFAAGSGGGGTSKNMSNWRPEGGFGWIVCACAFLAHLTTSGAQLSVGALNIVLTTKFANSTSGNNVHHWLGPLSYSISNLTSPLIVNLCRRNNVRILSLLGGILFPLSLLFTSFTQELHQIFFSFGLIGGIGSSLIRESSNLMLSEYFRRRRHFVEQVVLAGTGVGVTLFSLLYLSLRQHIEWSLGFQIGAFVSSICIILPAFYRTTTVPYSNNPNPAHQVQEELKVQRTRPSSILIPLGGDICHSLRLFCVPSLQPLLWSAFVTSFGLFAPVFLMSDFGKNEGLSGGSLLLLQTHLGLGISLGVILGAILTLCCISGALTGLSMIAISSVNGYYGYSLSAWLYGIALGSYLYTLKVLTMDLVRTKHWERIWSCIQSLMSPGVLLGSGLTSYLGKPGFYLSGLSVLIGAGLIGFQLIDLNKCGSPQSSSIDNDSPIPPAPPPVTPGKYGHKDLSRVVGGGGGTQLSQISSKVDGFYPLRKAQSLQQPYYLSYEGGDPTPMVDHGTFYPPGVFSPYCRECVFPSNTNAVKSGSNLQYPPIVRSLSLPQDNLKQSNEPGGPFEIITCSTSQPTLRSTGTQTAPSSPELGRVGGVILRPSSTGSLERKNYRKQMGRQKGSSSFVPVQRPYSRMSKCQNHVVFASNPQLFSPSTIPSRIPIPAAATGQEPHDHHHHKKPLPFSLNIFETLSQKNEEQPAFTRHEIDSSQMKKNWGPILASSSSSKQHQQSEDVVVVGGGGNFNRIKKPPAPLPPQQKSKTPINIPRPEPIYYKFNNKILFPDKKSCEKFEEYKKASPGTSTPPVEPPRRKAKVSSSDFDIEEPKFNSLRRPGSSAGSSEQQLPQNTQHMQHHQFHHHLQQQQQQQQHYFPTVSTIYSSTSNNPQYCPYCPIPHNSQNNPHPHLSHQHYYPPPPPQPQFQPQQQQHQSFGHHHQQQQQHQHHHQEPLNAQNILLQQQQEQLQFNPYVGYPNLLKRRNTWHHNKDFFDTITSSV